MEKGGVAGLHGAYDKAIAAHRILNQSIVEGARSCKNGHGGKRGFQAGRDLVFSQGLKGKECGEKKGKEKEVKKEKLERGEAVNQDP